MPIYEYQCNKCAYHFEIKQGFNQSSEAICPKCQGKARRIFQPAPIIFKGNGFYVTDNRSGNSENGGTAFKDKEETLKG